MPILETYTKLLEVFKHDLKGIEKENNNLILMATGAITLCEKALETLKELVRQRDFKSQLEEIHFFKNVKPHIFGTLIYYLKLYDIEYKSPKGRKKQRLKYFNDQMDKIQNYYNTQVDFCHYNLNMQTHLDEQYFLRDNKGKCFHIDICDYVTEKYFSTSHDGILATLFAYNKLEHYFTYKINQIENNQMETTINPFKKQSKLQWTGTPTELVEMAYSLYASGRVNNGNVDIIEVVQGLEDLLNTKVDDPYGTFSEIRGRKYSFSIFLDSLKESLLKYIKDLDDLKGKKRKKDS